MLELIGIRMGAIIIMLVVMGYCDLRNREIDDRLFIFFAAVTGALWIIDHNIDIFGLLMISVSCHIAVLGWKLRFFQTGDFYLILISTFMLPVYVWFPTSMLIAIGAVFTTIFAMIGMNVILNLFELRRHELFKGMKDSRLKKAVMFFMCHRHRKFERYIIISEDKDGNLSMWGQDYIDAKKLTKHYVLYNFPFITMLAPTAILLGILMII